MKHRLLYLLPVSALITSAGCKSDDPVSPAPVVAAPPVAALPLPAAPPTAVLDVIALPVRPEAIARGNGTTFYAGSTAAGTDTTINGMIVSGMICTR